MDGAPGRPVNPHRPPSAPWFHTRDRMLQFFGGSAGTYMPLLYIFSSKGKIRESAVRETGIARGSLFRTRPPQAGRQGQKSGGLRISWGRIERRRLCPTAPGDVTAPGLTARSSRASPQASGSATRSDRSRRRRPQASRSSGSTPRQSVPRRGSGRLGRSTRRMW